MSPRGFKLGLALFLVMSGLFGAKLTITGPGSVRTSWHLEAPALFAAAKPAPKAELPAEPAKSTVQPGSAAQDNPPTVETETAAHTAPPIEEGDKNLISAIRLELKTRGYEGGKSAGNLDLASRAAIIAFEADNDMRLTGEPSQTLLHRLLLGSSDNQANSSSPPAPRAEEVIRSVQGSLKSAGHPDLKVDGQMSSETVDTIRDFERSNAMKVTGRISGELVARLQHVARDVASGASR